MPDQPATGQPDTYPATTERGDYWQTTSVSLAQPEATAPDPSDCPKCGEWRDAPEADCAGCGYIPARPCGDPSGRCVYAGPHDGPHKVAPTLTPEATAPDAR